MSFLDQIQQLTKAELDRQAREEEERIAAGARALDEAIEKAKSEISSRVEEIKALILTAAAKGHNKIKYVLGYEYPSYNTPQDIVAQGIVSALRGEGFTAQTYHWQWDHPGGISDSPYNEEQFGITVEWTIK
jgi:hypothetical protein